jgi:hypothetical protein
VLQKLTTALARVPLGSAHGPWTPSIGCQHLIGAKPQPLWGGASKVRGARFTSRGSFDSIYIASDPITALTEVWALVMLPSYHVKQSNNGTSWLAIPNSFAFRMPDGWLNKPNVSNN